MNASFYKQLNKITVCLNFCRIPDTSLSAFPNSPYPFAICTLSLLPFPLPSLPAVIQRGKFHISVGHAKVREVPNRALKNPRSSLRIVALVHSAGIILEEMVDYPENHYFSSRLSVCLLHLISKTFGTPCSHLFSHVLSKVGAPDLQAALLQLLNWNKHHPFPLYSITTKQDTQVEMKNMWIDKTCTWRKNPSDPYYACLQPEQSVAVSQQIYFRPFFENWVAVFSRQKLSVDTFQDKLRLYKNYC